jgi:hypothetical protein
MWILSRTCCRWQSFIIWSQIYKSDDITNSVSKLIDIQVLNIATASVCLMNQEFSWCQKNEELCITGCLECVTSTNIHTYIHIHLRFIAFINVQSAPSMKHVTNTFTDILYHNNRTTSTGPLQTWQRIYAFIGIEK